MSGGMEFLQKYDRQSVGGDRKTQAGLSALCERIVLAARVIFSAFQKPNKRRNYSTIKNLIETFSFWIGFILHFGKSKSL